MPSKVPYVILCAGFVLAAVSSASAEPAGPGLLKLDLSAQDMPRGPFGEVQAVGSSTLQSVTGMADLRQFATANNNSIVAGNSVNGHSITGEIAIDGQSFQNMHGLSILTANTGNNVSINAAMNVNVSIQQ